MISTIYRFKKSASAFVKKSQNSRGKTVFRKKRFLVAIFKLSDETGSRFFESLDFTIQYHPNWKFAIRILKLSQLALELLAKYAVSAAILNFPDEAGSRFFELIYFTNHYYRTWKFAFRILKISQLNLYLLTKNRLLAAILIF